MTARERGLLDSIISVFLYGCEVWQIERETVAEGV